MTRRSGFFSIAAIHFHARSEAVIDPRVLRFSAWPAGFQREPSLAGRKRVWAERRLTECYCRSSSLNLVQVAGSTRPVTVIRLMEKQPSGMSAPGLQAAS